MLCAVRSAPCVRYHARCVYASWACSDIEARRELNSMCQSQYKQNAKQCPSDTNANKSEPTTTKYRKKWNKNIINIDFYEKCCWRLAIAAVVFVRERESRGRGEEIETSWQRSANETSNRTSWIPDRLAMLYNLCAQLIFMQFSFSNLNSLFFSHVRVIGSWQVMKESR